MTNIRSEQQLSIYAREIIITLEKDNFTFHSMKEFKINDFLTLKLEEGKTNIYVNDELFEQCKFLMLNIPVEETEKFDEIDSIDEVADLLGWRDGGQDGVKYEISPETEFWGHCSNLQAWYENEYDTRLLHSNLSFPLLKKLTEVGDPIAKRVFKEEIALRFNDGYPSVVNYILAEELLNNLNQEELKELVEQSFPVILNLLKAFDDLAREGAFKLCIFGDDFPGKTTFVNRYLTKVFDKDIKMTVGADFYEKELEIDGKNILLRIWDFGSEPRFKVLLPGFAKGADGGIFVFDITRYTSLKNIDDWLSIFETNVIFEENVLLVRKLLPIIMVGILTDGENMRSVSGEEGIKIAKSRNLNGYIECNLKTGKYVEEVFGDVTRLPRDHGIEVAEKNGIDSSEEVSSKTGQNVDKIFELMTYLILKRMEMGRLY